MKRFFLLLSFIAVIQSCSGILISAGLEPGKKANQQEKDRKYVEKKAPGILQWMDSLRANGSIRDTFIVRDGIRLHACYASAERQSQKTAVIVHGYLSNPTRVMYIARMFRDSLDYNVWLPSLRHHGQSGGKNIQMGWNDRLDVMTWSEIAHNYFKDTLQVFHGTSMGAACIMMTSGEVLPEYVKGFIEDCGYSSLQEEMQHVLNEKFRIKGKNIVKNSNLICQKRYGWFISDVSSERQLTKCTKPMFFIHGGADNFVPTYMVEKNYLAKTDGYRELWIAPGSTHARSYADHPSEYTARVRNFLSSHVE